MRIIHDINTPMQVAIGSGMYRNVRGKQGYNGVHVEIAICTAPPDLPLPDEPPYKEVVHEVIYLEGNLEHIRDCLEKCLEGLKSIEKDCKENLGELRATDCPNCTLADRSKFTNATHTEECDNKVR
jgi:hypothetical protein